MRTPRRQHVGSPTPLIAAFRGHDRACPRRAHPVGESVALGAGPPRVSAPLNSSAAPRPAASGARASGRQTSHRQRRARGAEHGQTGAIAGRLHVRHHLTERSVQ